MSGSMHQFGDSRIVLGQPRARGMHELPAGGSRAPKRLVSPLWGDLGGRTPQYGIFNLPMDTMKKVRQSGQAQQVKK